MMREHLRRPPDAEALNAKIAEAGMLAQNTIRLQSASGLFMILVNAYQGGITEASVFQSEERRAFYCGKRLS